MLLPELLWKKGCLLFTCKLESFLLLFFSSVFQNCHISKNSLCKSYIFPFHNSLHGRKRKVYWMKASNFQKRKKQPSLPGDLKCSSSCVYVHPCLNHIELRDHILVLILWVWHTSRSLICCTNGCVLYCLGILAGFYIVFLPQEHRCNFIHAAYTRISVCGSQQSRNFP